MSLKDNTVLIVDDDEDILFTIKMLLRKHVGHIFTDNNPFHLPRLLRQYKPDLVLLDMNFRKGDKSGVEGIRWLKKIKELRPETEVISITAHGDIEIAVSALKNGANDFIEKPWHNDKLLFMVNSALQISTSKRKFDQLESKTPGNSAERKSAKQEILGSSDAIQEIQRIIDKVAPTDANILITGENGTGKELVAKTIHAKSLRAKEVFVNVDLGAIPESLFESEMFGHKKGAFTGAEEDRIGRIQAANNGTLFLDEIGNLSLTAQSKLLFAIQNHSFVPVGSNRPVQADIRVIAATNESLQEMVKAKSFRQDLLYRLNTVEIKVPSLRERHGDIPILSKHFFDLYRDKYRKQDLVLSETAIESLTQHHWPGNIRELRHTIERAVILSDGIELNATDLNLQRPSQIMDVVQSGLNLEQMERKLVVRALQLNRGNISKAAHDLGLTRASLYRRLEKYGL